MITSLITNMILFTIILFFTLDTTFVLTNTTGLNHIEPTSDSIPYQVLLSIETFSSKFYCSGSLITKNFVLSVAHCLSRAVSVIAKFEKQDYYADEPEKHWRTVKNIIVHPSYDSMNILNDIALLELQTQVAPEPRIKYINIPRNTQKYDSFIGKQGLMYGWSSGRDGIYINPFLKQLSVKILHPINCTTKFAPKKWSSSNYICGLDLDDGFPCDKGDSGSALVIQQSDMSFIQIGILSFSIIKNCTSNSNTAWYTRVGHYVPWIVENSDYIDF